MSRITKALEKAKAARESGKGFSEEVFLHIMDNEEVTPLNKHNFKKEINPAYTKTRIIKIDPDNLRKKRIVSLSYDDPISDQIKILRTQVLDRMRQLGGNSILVASANPNEGKTLIALNLAISISQEIGHTVLLVEADMRTSSINDYLGMGTQKGLSDFLMNEAAIQDTLINPGIEKLVVLPAGRFIKTSTELLGSDRMGYLVKEMKTRYPERFIIFDGPPILSFADPLVFSRFIDAILLVVEAEKTTKKDVARVMELFKDKPVIGAIYNKAKE